MQTYNPKLLLLLELKQDYGGKRFSKSLLHNFIKNDPFNIQAKKIFTIVEATKHFEIYDLVDLESFQILSLYLNIKNTKTFQAQYRARFHINNCIAILTKKVFSSEEEIAFVNRNFPHLIL